MGKKHFYYLLMIIAQIWFGNPVWGVGCIDRGKEKVVETVENVFNDITSDLGFYFERDNLLALGGVLAAAGIISNTSLDSSIRHFWQDVIRTKTVNGFLKFPCEAGDFRYRPYYKGSILLGGLFFDESKPDSPFTILYNWGYRSLRTLYLAGAQKELFTWVVGNGRPKHRSSRWHPCKGGLKKEDKNNSGVGVSAHAFNGAIPFLTAAMMIEEPIVKYGLYVFSTLPGLARVNDDHHYFSQVFLGWSLSFLSAKAIDKTENSCYCPLHFHILPMRQGGKLYASLSF